MKSISQRNLDKTISKRFFLLSIFKGGVVGAIGWRFFDLQMIENRKYEKLSDNNQFNYHMIAPERGRILDRKMRLLAGNMDGFSLVLNWNKNINVELIIKNISSVINIDQKDLNNFYKEINSNNNDFAKEILITKNLSQKDVSKLAVRSIEFPEVSFLMTKKRFYPQGIIAGHITGYIGPYSEKNTKTKIKPNTSWLEVGKSGLEKFFDKELRGKFGRKRNEVTSKGHIVASQIYENTISGNDIQVSLDMGLQAFAVERFEKGNNALVSIKNENIKKQIEKTKNINFINNDYVYKDKKNRIVNPESGSLIVMDIENGELICCLSSPGYDPNIFSNDLDVNVWNNLKNNSRAPLLNRSMSGVYPPGSTIKMAVALAALENGIIDYNTKFFCDGAKKLGESTFHCWAKDGHGKLNLIEAIEQSCDVYFYELGLKVGIDKIALMMKRLGLGQYYNVEIKNMSKGVVPNIEWKLKRDGLQWSMGETLNASIGQGYLLTTPLQLTTMIARIANGKFSVTPTLMVNKNKNRFKDLNINPQHIDFIKKSMERVVKGNNGTAKKYQIGSKKVEMAGKTGTVQVVRISEAEREKGLIKNEDRPWKRRDHALFVGYAPASKPKYAITVVVEHGGSGSSTAAPIARDIFKYIFKI
ncbi:MAG: penicillin-binding protein 2 [Alphaproteobacteria bacterium TMED199]|nr:MAG: penicillin-binding protein 2 [Alphaproteobacteria bacterium TMED199]